jgi:sarcosine oxidase subunit beta
VVVNAAGAWAGKVAALAGVDLPVEPLRRMLVPTEPFDKVAHTSPMVVDMTTGFHYRPEGRGLLLAWNDPEETPGFKTNFDHGFIEKILTRGVARLPVLEEAEINPKRAWAGLYEMTPDHHPVLGEVHAMPGLFLANGFSGHGVMHSPATGRILADLITTGRTDMVESGLLGVERFAAGHLLHETAVL